MRVKNEKSRKTKPEIPQSYLKETSFCISKAADNTSVSLVIMHRVSGGVLARLCGSRISRKNIENVCNLSRSSVSLQNGPKIAIVGAGPAGFYAAQHIAQARPDAIIDIYERLPVPFGLVRFGVAPDHPDVKKCISTFNKTADLPNITFYGNTALGRDISLKQLKKCYNSVLLSYGAEEDQRLGIPGEHLQNVTAARSVVSMYNGLPGAQDVKINLDTETVVIIGIGNVAVDVARLILTPIDVLRKYDTTEDWLEKLRSSRVKRVVLVGRRGPLNISFTVKELREMLKLENVRPIFHKKQYLPFEEQVAQQERGRKRVIELLFKSALTEPEPQTAERWANAKKEMELKLLRSPLEFLPGRDGKSVEKIKLAVNVMKGDTVEETKETEEIETGLVLRSIGYKSIQADKDLPFNDKKGVAINVDGRVSEGVYAAGWLATGPRGVIVDTMGTAFKIAANVVADLEKEQKKKPGRSGMPSLPKSTSWEDWRKLENIEIEAGKLIGRPKEKITSVSEMLSKIQS